jgi:hypothetical protein
MTVPALSAIARSVRATTVSSVIPVVNANARAKIAAMFFMAVSPFQEPQHSQKRQGASVTAITFWRFFGDRKLLRQMSEDRRAS